MISYLYKNQPFGSWQFGKIGVLVNFIIQKLKSKHQVCLSFFWCQVLLREREKIFYTFSGPNCQNLGEGEGVTPPPPPPPPGTDGFDVCALALGFIIACLRSAYFTHYPRLRSLVIVLHCSQDCIFCGPKERKKRSRKQPLLACLPQCGTPHSEMGDHQGFILAKRLGNQFFAKG